MAELKIDPRINDCIQDLRTNWDSVPKLARKHNLYVDFVRDLQKKIDPNEKHRKIIRIPRTPLQQVVLADEPKPRSFHNVNASFLWFIALMLGVIGAVFNVQYWYAFGGIWYGMLGGLIDGITIFLPANLNYRRAGHYPLLGIWLICAGLSTLAALGFTANGIGDKLQGRESVAQHRKALTWEQTSLQTERATITENRDPLVIENAIQNERDRFVRNDLRAAKRMAEHRIELDSKLHQLSEDIANLPSIASKDPAADAISGLSRGWVDSGWVEKFRVIGFSFMPMLAGFLMAFARTLMAKD